MSTHNLPHRTRSGRHPLTPAELADDLYRQALVRWADDLGELGDTMPMPAGYRHLLRVQIGTYGRPDPRPAGYAVAVPHAAARRLLSHPDPSAVMDRLAATVAVATLTVDHAPVVVARDALTAEGVDR